MDLKEFMNGNKFICTVRIEFGLKNRNMGATLGIFYPHIVETKENTWMFVDGENGLSVRIENRNLEVLEYDNITGFLTIGTSDCNRYEKQDKELLGVD